MRQNVTQRYAKMGIDKGLTIGASLLLVSCATIQPSPLLPQPPNTDKPVIALVLGGGGAKGFAHIGVIKVLEANGITPNLIVGSSVGSFIGSLYASGKSASELEHLALTTSDSELTDLTLSYQGIIEGVKLREFVNTQVDNRAIEQLPIRFAAVATEKNSLQKKVFSSGETGLIVQASSSVPKLFIPPRIPDKVGKKYIDGGVSSMVPVDTAKDLGADIVIAVDIMNSTDYFDNNSSNPSTIWALIDTEYDQEGKYRQVSATPIQAEVDRADIIIRPDVAGISSFDTSRKRETIQAGEIATNNEINNIKEAIYDSALSHNLQP